MKNLLLISLFLLLGCKDYSDFKPELKSFFDDLASTEKVSKDCLEEPIIDLANDFCSAFEHPLTYSWFLTKENVLENFRTCYPTEKEDAGVLQRLNRLNLELIASNCYLDELLDTWRGRTRELNKDIEELKGIK